MVWNAAESFLWGFNNYQFWDLKIKMRYKDQNHFHIWRLKFWGLDELLSFKIEKWEPMDIFKFSIYVSKNEVSTKKSIFQSITEKIYIEEKNDIQNSKAKLSTNDNHSHLANAAHPWWSLPFSLSAAVHRLRSSLSLCFPSLLEYSINQGLT